MKRTPLQERLKISDERFDLLSKRLRDEFATFVLKQNPEYDTSIDIIDALRKETLNANEDIFICYSVGAMQFGWMKRQEE